jgi:hypothetical protein
MVPRCSLGTHIPKIAPFSVLTLHASLGTHIPGTAPVLGRFPTFAELIQCA